MGDISLLSPIDEYYGCVLQAFNIDRSMTAGELKDLFSLYSTVIHVQRLKSKGRKNAYAFVTFSNKKIAENALATYRKDRNDTGPSLRYPQDASLPRWKRPDPRPKAAVDQSNIEEGEIAPSILDPDTTGSISPISPAPVKPNSLKNTAFEPSMDRVTHTHIQHIPHMAEQAATNDRTFTPALPTRGQTNLSTASNVSISVPLQLPKQSSTSLPAIPTAAILHLKTQHIPALLTTKTDQPKRSWDNQKLGEKTTAGAMTVEEMKKRNHDLMLEVNHLLGKVAEAERELQFVTHQFTTLREAHHVTVQDLEVVGRQLKASRLKEESLCRRLEEQGTREESLSRSLQEQGSRQEEFRRLAIVRVQDAVQKLEKVVAERDKFVRELPEDQSVLWSTLKKCQAAEELHEIVVKQRDEALHQLHMKTKDAQEMKKSLENEQSAHSNTMLELESALRNVQLLQAEMNSPISHLLLEALLKTDNLVKTSKPM